MEFLHSLANCLLSIKSRCGLLPILHFVSLRALPHSTQVANTTEHSLQYSLSNRFASPKAIVEKSEQKIPERIQTTFEATA
jgi:hypothetical protein